MSAYIKGIDISNNNGSVNCSKIANDGVDYVYVKATEGKSYKDSYMDEFYNGCKANGLKVGAYHFLVGTSSPELQAINFYSKIKDYEWDLVPMMDIETQFEGLSDYVIRFVTKFKELCPWELGVYSYTSFISYIEDAQDIIGDFPFWEANYNNNPWNLRSTFFSNRVGHQYTEKGLISGVNSRCDVNVFTEGALLSNSTIPGTWINEANKWWYKHNDGTYTKDGWEKINGEWYMFDSKGWMAYAWRKDGNNWYFLGGANDGAMKYGWVLTDKKWYYLGTKDDGAMKIGWQKIDGKWYYFNSSGEMQTGWIKDNGKDYLLYSDGSMAHDCNLYGYNFNSSGVATKL